MKQNLYSPYNQNIYVHQLVFNKFHCNLSELTQIGIAQNRIEIFLTMVDP